MAQTVLSRLERGGGKRPSLGVLQRLADTFGVNLEQLTGDSSLPTEVVIVTPEGLKRANFSISRSPGTHASDAIVVGPDGPHRASVQIAGASEPLPSDFIVSGPDGMYRTRAMVRTGGVRDATFDKLEQLILQTMSQGDYTVADFDAARSVLWETYALMPKSLDHRRGVEAITKAARALRLANATVNTTSVLAHIAYHALQRQPGAQEPLAADDPSSLNAPQS